MRSFVGFTCEDATDALRQSLGRLTNTQADGFILPDGTALSLGRFNMHWSATDAIGIPLSAAMKQGIVRYVGRAGITVSAPISSAAAQTVHDNFLHEPLKVDVMDASGRVKSYKQFGQRHTPDAIRNFVSRAIESGKAGIWIQESMHHPQRNSGIVARFSGFVNHNRPVTHLTEQPCVILSTEPFEQINELAYRIEMAANR